MVRKAKANNDARKDMVLRSEISDVWVKEVELIKKADELLDQAYKTLTEAYKFDDKLRTSGPSIYNQNMINAIQRARKEADFPIMFYNEKVTQADSTAVGNAAAFVDPTYFDDGENY